MKERLERLARKIETYAEYKQHLPFHCAAALARQLWEDETGKTHNPHTLIFRDEEVAEYFGLTVSDLDALYMADYSRLNIGLEDVPDDKFNKITREQAASVVRKLADRG